MQLPAADFCLGSEDRNLCHQVVVNLAFDRERRIDVDLAAVGFQIGKFGFADEAVFGLRFGECHPNGTPEFAPFQLGKQRAKFSSAISPRERRSVRCVIHGMSAVSATRRPEPFSDLSQRLMAESSAVIISTRSLGSSFLPVTIASNPRTARS